MDGGGWSWIKLENPTTAITAVIPNINSKHPRAQEAGGAGAASKHILSLNKKVTEDTIVSLYHFI